MSRYGTLRPRNKCNRCDYGWYPRGKDLSRCCPRCGSKNVEIVTASPIEKTIGIMLVLFIAFLAFDPFGKKNKDKIHTEHEFEKAKNQYQSQPRRTNSTPKQKKDVVYRTDVDDLVRNFGKPKDTSPMKEETEFEKKLREREEKRQRMEEVHQKTQLMIAEQERRREQELIEKYDAQLYNKFSMKLRRKSGKRLQTLYVIKRICKNAGVPFMEGASLRNVPKLKEYTISRFQVKKKTYHDALHIMTRSAGVVYEVTKDGVVLFAIK